MKKLGFIILSLLVAIPIVTNAKSKKETNYRNALVYAYSPANSVYEDDNIKLEIYDGGLWATNKTEKTIFLDLSQCFGVHNGSSYPILEEQTDEKKASKAKNSTSIDEFKSVPPSTGGKQNETFIARLDNGVYGKYSTSESPSGTFSEYDERLLTIINELVNEALEGDPNGKEYVGTAYRHLTEDESINNIGVNVAYAFNKRAEEWTPAAISTWVSDVYFVPYYVEMPQELTKKDKRGFGVKKTEAAKVHLKADSPFEFDEDRSPITVLDWTGNYKKGTFELNYTKISKKKSVSFGKGLLFGGLWGGLGSLLISSDEVFYKSLIHFDGQNDDWGKMKYMNNTDLSKFEND